MFKVRGLDLAIYACSTFAVFILPIDFYFKYKLKILKFKREFIMLLFFIPGALLGFLFSSLFD